HKANLIGSILGRQRRAHCQPAHLARHVLAIRSGMWAMRDAAALTMGCSHRTLAGAAGPFLAIQLACAAGDLAATARVVGAVAGVGLLANDGLVHHRDVRLDAENILGELDGPDLVAGLIEEFCFHQVVSSYFAAFTARRTITNPFLAPGTDPRTSSKCLSA